MKAIKYIIASIIITCSAHDLHALEPVKNTKLWDSYIGNDERSYYNTALEMDSKGNALLVAGKYSVSLKERNKIAGVFIRRTSKNGSQIKELYFKEDIPDIGKLVDVKGVSAQENGDVVFVARSEADKTVLVKADMGGKVLFMKSISGELAIKRLLTTSDKGFLLLGHNASDAEMLKYDSSGKEMWRKSYDRGQTERFVDGLEDNGAILVVENSGTLQQFYMGVSEVFITRYSPLGEKINETKVTGRYGSITRGRSENLMLVYDKSAGVEQDIWANAYDGKLSQLWSRQVTTTKLGFEQFKATALTDGSYIIAGSVSSRSWVSMLDPSAKNLDQVSIAPDVAVGTDLIADDENCYYVVGSVINLNKDRIPFYKVKVSKFQVK